MKKQTASVPARSASIKRRPSRRPKVPAVDLAAIAGQIPAEILQQLATAVQSGRWLFAVWHIAGSRIQLQRTATNFPIADLDKSVQLLAENLQSLKPDAGPDAAPDT